MNATKNKWYKSCHFTNKLPGTHLYSIWGHFEKVCLRAASLYIRDLSTGPGPDSRWDGNRWDNRSVTADATGKPGPSCDVRFISDTKDMHTDFRAACWSWRHTVAHCNNTKSYLFLQNFQVDLTQTKSDLVHLIHFQPS